MSNDANGQMPAYTEAVRSGLYAKQSGLVGKYDNVRRLWEDEITRILLRPHLQRLIQRCRTSLRRIRILDLGCGSADGFELLSGVRDRDADLEDFEVDLLSTDVLSLRPAERAPVNTMDFPVLEHEMARLRRYKLLDFNRRVRESLDLPGIRTVLSEVMEWSPAEFALWGELRTNRGSTLNRMLREVVPDQFGDVRLKEEM